MGYLSIWKVLEEMTADLKRKGITIPAEMISNLRSAKTLINVLRADPTCIETSQKIEENLLKVESFLVSEAQKKLGTEYVEKWLKKLDEAGKKLVDEEEKETRFVPGLPRKQKWIRIKPTPELPMEKIKKLAEESNLSHEIQSDGCLLVHGKDKRIKEFVKKMATKHETKAKK